MKVTKILETTILSGGTTATFTDSDIPNSLIRIYSTDSNVYPLNVTLSSNTLTITYEAVSSEMGVAIELVKEGLEIVDDLTTTSANKALSANQGYVLKGLIDNIVIPTGYAASAITYDNTVTGMTADDVQEAIDEVFTSVSNGKELIADAITDKGVTTSATDTFAQMASNIEDIPTGGGGTQYKTEFVFNGATNGSNTFTVPADGTYLLIAAYSFRGSASITIPEGRTALYTDDISASDPYGGGTYYRGCKIVVANLLQGDTVTLVASYYSTWLGYGSCAYKLDNVANKTYTNISKTLTKDTTGSMTAISTSGLYLIIGISTGSSSGNSYVVNGKQKGLACAFSRCGNYAFTVVMLGEVASESPELSMYGYNGGQATYFVIELT